MDPSVDRVEILCPRCGEGFTGSDAEIADRSPALDRALGRSVRCPHCGSAIPFDELALREDELLEALRLD